MTGQIKMQRPSPASIIGSVDNHRYLFIFHCFCSPTDLVVCVNRISMDDPTSSALKQRMPIRLMTIPVYEPATCAQNR
jgi:hypothetical protein